MSDKTAGPWITEERPDAEMVVLMRVADDEYPVWPGWYDGERWWYADAVPVGCDVLGWMELDDAARLLDENAST